MTPFFGLDCDADQFYDINTDTCLPCKTNAMVSVPSNASSADDCDCNEGFRDTNGTCVGNMLAV